MLRSALAATVSAIICFPALAATDDEIAEKCIVGAKTFGRNNAQVNYLPGKALNGSIRRMGSLVSLHGTWDVQNGVLTFKTEDEAGGISTGSYPVRMDDAGKCYLKKGGTEVPIKK
jgi:hypothetical protein